MRMNLYEFEIERAEGTVRGHLVAPTEKQAAVMIIDHDLALEKEHLEFTLERVDTKLSEDMRKGLDDLLSIGRAGFASFSDLVGWLVHTPVQQALSFYRFFTPEGEETFVVAEDEQEAVDIYATSYTLQEDPHRLFSFVDGLADLSPEQRRRLESILEFGPAGIAVYDDFEGWSVHPPA